jgi:hypothetical protein|tara:strand:- start:114 stop:545 length:432 start_codon:yes stop_codon:yes gene_type:complete
MSISKDNEQEQEVITLDLKDIMAEIEANGELPDGFVMVYMLADPSEAEDDSQTDFFFRAFGESRNMIHKKTVLMYQELPITRHELAWFGDWNGMQEIIESTEAEVKNNLMRFMKDETLMVMPRMDFMFVNQPLVVEEEDDGDF